MAPEYSEEELKRLIREGITEEKQAEAARAKKKLEDKIYYNPFFIWGLFAMVGPFIMPLVWTHPKYSLTKKIVISITMVAVTIALAVGCMKMIEHFYSKVYDMLNM